MAALVAHYLIDGDFFLGCLFLGAHQVYQIGSVTVGQFVVGGCFGLDDRVQFFLFFGLVLRDGEEADIDALVKLGALEIDGDRLGDLHIDFILLVGVAHLEDCPGCSFLLK